ncbi:MAG: DUF2207 domain-containing protein [Bauldia litoralis]
MGLIRLAVVLAAVVLSGAWASAAGADAIRYRPGDPVPSANFERILNFHSAITINRDASLTVTETIQVNAIGLRIKQGIFRDFPTTYRNDWGARTVVGFTVLEVTRDGKPEPWFTNSLDNGIRIYIGRRGHRIRRGLHTYTIKYRTTRQLGFFPTYDELYWNVTGTGWAFAIDRAEAVVTLPAGAVVKARRGYTGPQGARGVDWFAVDAGPGKAGFATSRRLGPRQGLTIAVAWQKGLVPVPTDRQRLVWLLEDNIAAVFAVFLLVALFAYYLVAWIMVGRDPRKGTIIPRFEPPAGFSPAAVRYVTKTKYDGKAFSAALINMAVKGFMRIRQTTKTTFILDKQSGARLDMLSPGERAIAKELFKTKNEVRLGSTYRASVKRALTSHQERVKADYDSGYFLRNRGYRLVGLASVVLSILIVAIASPDFGTTVLSGVGFSIALWAMLLGIGALIGALKSGVRIGAAIGSGLIALVALVFLLITLGVLLDTISAPGALAVALIGLVGYLFDGWLKAPTRAGRKILDQIEGLKMYLTVAEKDRLNLINPPDRTPETFERLLPFALALDVEQRWSEQFSDILAAAGREPGQGGYHPLWYIPLHTTDFSDLSFTDSLGSTLSSTVSSAATPPGSSSGSGGGGFSGGSSGGGGGGGGGGGW